MDATPGARAQPADSVTFTSSDDSLDDVHEPTRLLDAGLGALMLLAVAVPRAPGNLAVGLVVVAALVALAATRRPTRSFSPLDHLPAAVVVVLGYLVVVTVTSPDDSLFGWPKRAMRLALVLSLLLALVSGRLHLPSVVRGAGVGLSLNAVLFYAGLTPRPYGDLLSGFLLDKNQAGLAYTVVGLLMIGIASSVRDRVALTGITSALVWLTGSRTSLAALACGLAWYLLRPKLPVASRLLLGGAFAVAIQFVQENYARTGVFADRAGSDQFRAQIDAASEAKLEFAPFQGMGLGEAWVTYPNGDIFFFHNSYWSALLEGGWPYLAVILVATVFIAVRPLRAGPPPSPLATAGEAANIAVLICALRLGEVFGTTVAVLALAVGIIGYLQVHQRALPPAPIQ